MVSEIDELEALVAQEEGVGNKDCGCASQAGMLGTGGEIADLVSLEADLAEALAAPSLGGESGAGVEELELELLDEEAAAAAELDQDVPGTELAIGLSDLIELLETHPGLKVTLSF